jgi:hypothetical protein
MWTSRSVNRSAAAEQQSGEPCAMPACVADPRTGRTRAPGQLLLPTARRSSDHMKHSVRPADGGPPRIVDPDHLARERDDERGLADELERRRAIQTFDDGREAAVLPDP